MAGQIPSSSSAAPETNIQIRPGTIAEIVALSQKIPEFIQPYRFEEYHKRLSDAPHLILLAEVVGVAAGFKAGYERDGSFYSWMGGVLPAFRRMGIAQRLAEEQEKWVRSNGYTTITCKTRNYNKGMLLFALSNGFEIVGFEERPQVTQNRILLRKQL